MKPVIVEDLELAEYAGPDTDNIDLLGSILEEVKKISEKQDQQGEELEKIKEKIEDVTTGLELVRQAQLVQGVALGAIEQQCGRRLETCSEILQRFRDRAVSSSPPSKLIKKSDGG